MDDVALARLVREVIAERCGPEVQVRVDRGTVVLRGQVPEWSLVVAAGHAAAGVRGVGEVVNLVLSPDAVPVQAPSPVPGIAGRYDV